MSRSPAGLMNRPFSDSGTLLDFRHRPLSDNTGAGISGEALAIDRFFEDLAQYEKMLEEMSGYSHNHPDEFNEDLKKLEGWFLARTENERTTVLYALLRHCTQLQVRFFTMVLQEIAKKDPVVAILSPHSSYIDDGRMLSGYGSGEPETQNSYRLYERSRASRMAPIGTPASPTGNNVSSAMNNASGSSNSNNNNGSINVNGTQTQTQHQQSHYHHQQQQQQQPQSNVYSKQQLPQPSQYSTVTNGANRPNSGNNNSSTYAHRAGVSPHSPSSSYGKPSQTTAGGKNMSSSEPLRPQRPVPPIPNSEDSRPRSNAPYNNAASNNRPVSGLNPNESASRISPPSTPNQQEPQSSAAPVTTTEHTGVLNVGNLDIATWLRNLRLHKYNSLFENHDWDSLVKLTDDDLQEMGMHALGARRKFLKAVDLLYFQLHQQQPQE